MQNQIHVYLHNVKYKGVQPVEIPVEGWILGLETESEPVPLLYPGQQVGQYFYTK